MPFRILVALAVEIFAVIGTLAAPYFGFLFFVFFTILRPQDDRPNVQGLHYPMVLLITTLAATFPRMAKDQEFSGFQAIGKLVLIIVYFFDMVVSAIATGYSPASAYRVHEFIVVVLICIMLLFWGATEIRIWGIMGSILFAGLMLSRDALTRSHWMQEAIGGESFSRMDINRLNGNFGSPNYIALLMAVLILISISFLYTRYSKWLKLAAVGSIGVFFRVFLLANSRGASLGLAAALVTFFLFQNRKAVTGFLLVLLVGGALALAPQAYFDRLTTIVHYENDQSATSRLELWNIGMQLIKDHPVFGVGPDNFMAHAFNGPHDCYIQAAAEMGLPAAFLYCAILISGMLSCFRAMSLSARIPNGADLRTLSIACLCIIAHMVVQGFTTGFAHREFVYIFIAISHCTFLVASREAKRAVALVPAQPTPFLPPPRVRALPV
jgi:putative inorganic carbon (HCO3(-)) transporter